MSTLTWRSSSSPPGIASQPSAWLACGAIPVPRNNLMWLRVQQAVFGSSPTKILLARTDADGATYIVPEPGGSTIATASAAPLPNDWHVTHWRPYRPPGLELLSPPLLDGRQLQAIADVAVQAWSERHQPSPALQAELHSLVRNALVLMANSLRLAQATQPPVAAATDASLARSE